MPIGRESSRLLRPRDLVLSLFRIGVSWGGFESLVLPAGAVQARQKGGRLDPGGLPVGLVRLFIGLEDAGDRRIDLEKALDAV